MRFTCLLVFASVLFSGTSTAALASGDCTEKNAIHAARIVYTIGTWNDLFKFYTQFESCDDGDVALGNSDRVADLLANHWDKIGQLVDATQVRPAFEGFVLYHIDTTMTPDQAKTVLENARNHCPDGDTKLCRKIEEEVLKSTQQ